MASDIEEAAAVAAERDEWKRRAEYAERELSDAFGLPAAIGPAEGEAKRIVDKGRAAIAERDRLRAELEALRDAMVNEWRCGDVDASSAALRLRFDAILSGEGER